MSEPLPLVDSPERACGPCTVCCSVFTVEALQKPTWQRCEHVCEQGCGIHERRPEECRAFECMWLLGRIGADETTRPDQLGLIFAPYSVFGRTTDAISCLESRPGAAEEHKEFLEALSRDRIVCVCTYGDESKRTILAPPHLYLRALQLMEAAD